MNYRGGRQNHRSEGRMHGKGGPSQPSVVSFEELKVEQGIVSNLREKFGFIECADREGQIFFHVSELLDAEERPIEHDPEDTLSDLVEVGTDVEFRVQENATKEGRTCARQVKILPKGTVKLEEISEERYRGVVERELRGGGFMRHRGHAYGGRISFKPSTTDGECAPEFLEFEGSDVSADEQVNPLVGDEVEFNIRTRRKDSSRRACNVNVTKHHRKTDSFRSEVNNVEFQVKDGTRLLGLISFLEKEHGFVRTVDESASLYFNTGELKENNEHVTLNTGVEFTVSFDPRVKRRCATDISILPAGSVQGKEINHERLRGVIQEASSLQTAKDTYLDGIVEVLDDICEQKVFPYSGNDVNSRQMVLSVGDKVEFSVERDFRSNSQRAINLVLVESAGCETYIGSVGALKTNFGFIKCAEIDDDLFFHFSNLQHLDPAGLKSGQTVEFNMVLDSRTGRRVATNVRKAAEGVSAYSIQTKEKISGTCVEPLSFTKGKNKESSTSFGRIEYTDPSSEEVKVVQFSQNDLADPRLVPRLDEAVHFHLATARSGASRERAVEVSLVPAAFRVHSLKDGYGFLQKFDTEDQGRKPTFFHFMEVEGNVQLQVGDEVECFLVINPRNDELIAKRVVRTKQAPEHPRRNREIKFAGKGFGSLTVRLAKGPDGTKGFTLGRGKEIQPSFVE